MDDLKRHTGTIIVEFEYYAPASSDDTLQEANERVDDFEFKLSASSFVYCENSPIPDRVEILSSYLDSTGIDPDELDLLPAKSVKDNRIDALTARLDNIEASFRFAKRAIDNIAGILDENNIASPWQVHTSGE